MKPNRPATERKDRRPWGPSSEDLPQRGALSATLESDRGLNCDGSYIMK